VPERERVVRRALAKLVEGNDLVEERGERGVVPDALEREFPAACQPTELALVRFLAQRAPDRIGGVGREIGRRDRAPEASGAPSLGRRERNARGDEEQLQPTNRSSVLSQTWYSAWCAPTWQSVVPSWLTASSKRPASVASVQPATTTGANRVRYDRYQTSANGAS
jgi:hypothetical protein